MSFKRGSVAVVSLLGLLLLILVTVTVANRLKQSQNPQARATSQLNQVTSPPSTTPSPSQTPKVKVDSLVTGLKSGAVFTPNNNFTRGQTVFIQARVTANLPASVQIETQMPKGEVSCNFTTLSNSDGLASGSCPLPPNSPVGTWQVTVVSVTLSGAKLDPSSILKQTFTVK